MLGVREKYPAEWKGGEERGTDCYVISKVRLDKGKDGAAQEIFTGCSSERGGVLL